MDLAKAFDCVDHSILLQKLPYYGVNGDALSWLTSFLSRRTQQVNFQGSLSSSGCMKVGVPQGSILGPLLFSIYVNDLPNVISLSDVNMFADDTEIHFSHSDLLTVERTLQADIQNVSFWLVANKLKLNIVKSLCMLIGSRQRISGKSLNLFLDNSALKQLSVARYLGVYFDRYLTWDSHINYVLQRVRRKLYMINRLRPVAPRVLHLLYQAFVLPIFDYCDTVWSPSNASCIRRLERVHSKFLSSLPPFHITQI